MEQPDTRQASYGSADRTCHASRRPINPGPPGSLPDARRLRDVWDLADCHLASPRDPSPSLSSLPSSAPTPSGLADPGSVVIDDAVAPSVMLPWGATDPRPLGVFGSRAYYLELASGKDPATGKMKVPLVYRIHVADVATGSTADIVTLDSGHMIASGLSFGTSAFGGFTATADHLYWVEIWYDGLPNLDDVGGNAFGGLPQHWQVVAFDPASGSRSIIASGTNHRVAVGMEGATINPPVLAVDGDRLAYSLEAVTTGAPNGNKIVLRSLVDGKVVGTVTTTGFVPWIGLAGTVMAYREALTANLDGSSVRDARLILRTFTADAGAVGVVDDHVADAAISGDRLVWGRSDTTDGSAWTTLLSDGVPVHIAGPTAVRFSSGSEPGIFQFSTSAGFAAWGATGTVNGSDQSIVTFLWTVGDLHARVMVPSSLLTVTVSDGWLTWNDGTDPRRLRGLPLGSVALFAR